MFNLPLKRIFIYCILLLACIQPSMAGIVVNDTIPSKILGEAVPLKVYLPNSFKQEPEQHYPVLYLLHGLSDNEQCWMEKGQMDRVVDEFIASGEAQEMVVIMPCAGGPDIRNTWNGYFNMEGWNYEDFFFKELLPTIEDKYRAGGCRNQRAIAGLSMGGGGSVNYALRYPDMFCACYAMSAWLGSNKHLRTPEKRATDKFSQLTETVDKLAAVKLLETMTQDELQALRSVAWFIDCGDDDFLLEQSELLHMKMRHLRIPVQFRVRNGDHNWEYWHNALRLCLPFVSRNFK